MRALVCQKYGLPKDLVLEEKPTPLPGPKEVLVSVKSAAINFPDTLIIQGRYQYKPELPFVPGSDLAGIVKTVGVEVKSLKTGDEVFVIGEPRTDGWIDVLQFPILHIATTFDNYKIGFVAKTYLTETTLHTFQTVVKGYSDPNEKVINIDKIVH